MTRVLTILLGIILCTTSTGFAQDAKDAKPDFAEPKKDWKWDEDKRFDFLMERLASLEASLDAVDRAIAKASGKKGAKRGEARRAEADNSAMDRKGGGPMKWNEFYGTTAEKFFYHPVDPSTTYHTSTVLSQVGTQQEDKVGASVQGNSGVPVHQRPPQFDYIYRANKEAKERAESEAAAIQGQVDALLERRDKLEKEQADLWCRLAFRAIQRLNIPRRPELRFRLVAASTETKDEKRAEVLEAAARFLATSLLIIDKVEEDQEVGLTAIKTIVANARNEFEDVLLAEADVTTDSSNKETPLGQFTFLAQLLDDTSSNLSESYEVAIDGSRAKDAARKDQFRGLLQRSLIEYAQIVMALDESTRAIQKDWMVKVDTTTTAAAMNIDWGGPNGVAASASSALPGRRGGTQKRATGSSRAKWKGQVLSLGFAEITDGEVKDESGAGHDGTLRDISTITDRERGQVLKCGEAGYVAIASTKLLNPEKFTVSAWVNPAVHSPGQMIVDKSDWADNNFARGFSICLGDQNLPDGCVSLAIGGGNWTHAFSKQSVPFNEWTQVAGTFDGKELCVYLNGEEDNVVSVSSSSIKSSDYAMRIGACTFDTRIRRFQGLIDDVMMFDRALSPKEVREIYEATRK
jgi:hypothetical protein